MPTKYDLAAGLSGVLFGLGLAIARMTDPQKVLNFLDVTGTWDPSLAFVMGGALLVTIPAFAFILRRPRPLLADAFRLPPHDRPDGALLVGAALFGVGWGLSGLCPGPAITTLGSFSGASALVFAAMAAGMLLHDRVRARG